MTVNVQLVPTAFSLAAVFAWGSSDFLGGYATQRANSFVVSTIAHASGLLLMLSLATVTRAQLPSHASMAWAVAGGTCGGIGLAIFYRALAMGRMGLTAPVSALIGAALPTGFAMFTEGLPRTTQLLGFVLAGVGIWLISRTEDPSSFKGIELAALAGLGFAGFFLCVRQASGSALWIASFSRTGAVTATGIAVLMKRSFREITPSAARWGMLAGCLDVSGTALFVRASQTGRLDTAVVLTSLYPAVTVLLARLFLNEHFTRWKAIGILAALLAVPMIATG